jgi:hypothetical protein
MADEDIDSKRLQKRLFELRTTGKRKDESVREFGRQARISPDHVALMEGRKKKALKKSDESSPTVVMLHRYLSHCDVSLTQFFSDFEGKKPESLTPAQAELLETIRTLIQAGEDVERRVRERIDEIRAWLQAQPRAPARPRLRVGTKEVEGDKAARSRRKKSHHG